MTDRERTTDQAHRQFSDALQSALSLAEVGSAFLSTATAVLPADAFGLYRLDDRTASPVDVLADADAKFLEAYEDYGRASDPVLRFVLEQRRPVDSSRAARPGLWESSGARAALGGAGLDHSLEAPVIASGTLIGTINFARARQRPGFSSTELTSARIVSEQLGLAIERALRYESTCWRARTFELALDRLPHGVIVTDFDAQVIFRNRHARNRNVVTGGAATGAGSDVVASSVVEALQAFGEGMRVHTSTVMDPLSRARVVVKSCALRNLDGAAVSFVYECGEADARRIPAWHVLTRREQEIAQLVSEGLTSRQIAERAFITENTVKQHLKRVFAKTDVRNRAELVQLIWASGGDPAGPPPGDPRRAGVRHDLR
jgi:DNA-binding CsgD family transcriptional regulator